MILLTLGLLAAPPLPEPMPPPAAPPDTMMLAQLSIRSRIVIRVQTAVAPPPVPIILQESHGPRCIPMGAVQGAAVIAENSVDFILRGGTRVRARFSASCPALDYYTGFYIVPSADGRICADRDVVRSRAGGECAIDKFRKITVKVKR